MIKAPYNFVPLSDKVFFPPWTNQVSHDVPFSDGESGEIEVAITVKSPIFIRDHKYEKEFCHYTDEEGNKHYYIPGSSVKGMVRNVLEIMSFSKMKFVDDKTYAVRDIRNRNLYRNHFQVNNIYCGWLFKKDGVYKIEDCGIPMRIKYDDIQSKFPDFRKEYFLISEDDLVRQGFSDAQKSNVNIGSFDNRNSPYKKAYEKYRLIGEDNILNQVYNFEFIEEDQYGKELVRFSNTGEIRGRLVLTGHPSARVENWDQNAAATVSEKGKIYDFVFEEFAEDEKAFFTIGKEIIEKFKFAYFDGSDTQPKESEDWAYWKEKLHSGQKVPVFFQVGENAEGKRYVKHFGLSYLYKLPYKHSLHYGIPLVHFSDKADMAETIFGYISNDTSLKGRVQFSHFLANRAERDRENLKYILGLPRASYYPIYIHQNGNNCEDSVEEYKTYMDDAFVLAGRKRYPIHRNPNLERGDCHQKVESCFYPLNNAEFSGKIRVHNLRKSEIGALLSALTFHATQGCFHNIGLAKAYGLGKIEVTITGLNGFKLSINEYLQSYERLMSLHIDNWLASSQLTELVTMASEQNDQNLRFMDPQRGRDSYARNKKEKSYLCLYSRLNGVTPKNVNSLLEPDNGFFAVEELAAFLKISKEKILRFLDEESIDKDRIGLEIAKDIKRYLTGV